ncbi:MAG: nodulation protein NfeD, partial [Deltaproteobacteria bacterium]|nr:nodulation protein NfeD [Deltaproteobacteria bacterium]
MLRKIVRAAALTAAVFTIVLLSGQHLRAADKAPVFDVITISAAITPPVAEYILESIGEAAKSGAEGLVIRLDTP